MDSSFEELMKKLSKSESIYNNEVDDDKDYINELKNQIEILDSELNQINKYRSNNHIEFVSESMTELDILLNLMT